MTVLLFIIPLAIFVLFLIRGSRHLSHIFDSAWGESGDEGRKVIPEDYR